MMVQMNVWDMVEKILARLDALEKHYPIVNCGECGKEIGSTTNLKNGAAVCRDCWYK